MKLYIGAKEMETNKKESKIKKTCNDCRVAQEGLTNFGILPIVCDKCIKEER